MRWKLGLLVVAVALLVASTSALADCCNFLDFYTGPSGCNFFGCNCEGPCSNFGHTCTNGPIKLDGEHGQCPGYQWCIDGTCCGPNAHCFVDPSSGVSRCAPNQKSLTRARPFSPTESTRIYHKCAQGYSWNVNTRTCIPTPSLAQAPPATAEERFKAIDADKDGHLSFEEVKAWAAKNGSQLSESELKKKFDEVDVNKDGVIHPTEFDKHRTTTKKK
ncbi:MAG TPA: EF-hand domain-containing protein [Thermoanaerobaculia bacterium]|nr:EF-hand domain-containing protein [Thermoanaerobaculia bacterium]